MKHDSGMTADDMRALRGDQTQAAFAKAIGRSRRQIVGYESGEYEIPLIVELACAALKLGITEYAP